jgi:hypothetical protein
MATVTLLEDVINLVNTDPNVSRYPSPLQIC